MLALTSFDIAALAHELQGLVGKRLNKVYQCKGAFSLKFSSHTLNILLPGLAFLSSELKYSTPEPSSFTMSLRKHISNARLVKLDQLGPDRILSLELERGERFSLVVELFSKGNLLLLDSAGKILTLYSTQEWRSRKLKRGLAYSPPPPNKGYDLPLAELEQALTASKQDSLVKALAVEFGLGGLYSEEVCSLAGLDKNTPPANAPANPLNEGLKKLQAFPLSPRLYYADKPLAITCIELSTLQGCKQEGFSTLSAAIEHYAGLGAPPSEPPAIRRQKAIIAEQEGTINRLSALIEESTKKGEAVYENYGAVSSLLEGFSSIAAKEGWEQGFSWLASQPRVKSVSKQGFSFVFES
jgi:predicted ribosome quality control (RQC) complex YloA/Tae2 family protein